MTNHIITLLSGANKIARKSAETLKDASADYIEDNIIKGNYVTRQEYEQLQKLVIKLQDEIKELKKTKLIKN